MEVNYDRLKDSLFESNNKELKKSIILVKNSSFDEELFKKMVLALFNNNEEVKVIYTYENNSCSEIRNWTKEIVCSPKEFIAPLQFLTNVKIVVMPGIDMKIGSELVNFDTDNIYVKLIIDAINQKIPVYISFNDETLENANLIKKKIELSNEIQQLGIEVKAPEQLSLLLNIKNYENLTLENVRGVYSMNLNNLNVAQYIDHTFLKPEGTYKDIDKLCEEAKQYNFKAVCVNGYWTKRAKDNLQGTSILVATVVGFPLGAMTTEAKAFETKNAIENGSDEIDMVINIGELKAGNYEAVQKDIAAVVNAANGKTVKVIIEACLLTDEEKVKACLLAKNAGAHFVKTSTGFSKGGATLEDVYLMKKAVGDSMGVKAAGGIRDYETAVKMIEAGANRLGTSSGVKIVTGQKGGTNESY